MAMLVFEGGGGVTTCFHVFVVFRVFVGETIVGLGSKESSLVGKLFCHLYITCICCRVDGKIHRYAYIYINVIFVFLLENNGNIYTHPSGFFFGLVLESQKIERSQGWALSRHIYIYISLPRTQKMTFVLIGKGLVLGG